MPIIDARIFEYEDGRVEYLVQEEDLIRFFEEDGYLCFTDEGGEDVRICAVDSIISIIVALYAIQEDIGHAMLGDLKRSFKGAK